MKNKNTSPYGTPSSARLSEGLAKFKVSFSFFVHNRKMAEALTARLRTKHGYAVDNGPHPHLKGSYWVGGTTQPMALSDYFMTQFVARMVNYTNDYPCMFEGWWVLTSSK